MNRTSTRARPLRVALGGALLCALGATANAQSVAFSGMLGDKALLIINGQARGVAVGATLQGVKLVRIDGAQAQVETGGKTLTLRLGGTAVVAGDSGGGGSGSRIVLPVGSGGHYTGLASINGHPVQFLVDTGATMIAMSADVATQIGLDPANSTLSAAMTANGAVATRTITLNKVTIGDVTVYNVQAMVMPQAMPMVLLGNTYLSHFQMHNDSNSLVLDKKN
ncbi:MAG: TIGR02281 family clan AA aspartic protease [Vitreoscilla sp.]